MTEERKRILQMIEDGVITASEAEELLEALEHAEEVKHQSLSTKVDWNAEQYAKGNSARSSKNYFKQLLGDTIKKIKNVDLDFNFGPHYDVSHIFQHQGVTFSQIEIEVANGSVRVIPWDEEDVRMECEVKVYQVNDQTEAREHFMQCKEYDVGDHTLRFQLDSKKMKADLTLYIPKRLYKTISVKLFNGVIDAEQMDVKQFQAKTTNGKISLHDIRGNELEVESSNSAMALTDIHVSEVKAETLNGKINIEGSIENVQAKCVNGNIHCTWKQGTEAHRAVLKTTTGNINVHLPTVQSVSGTIQTNVGRLKCYIPTLEVQEEVNEILKKEMRFCAGEGDALHINGETTTGDICIYSNDKK
ncbi:DUF4097 family beta strand repeat-containing protein [Pontibacillus litoralis]|uniref:Uncharacterized protein n=1 Tax=Pontibacillus litoralis JSM 072002 TaxID=1385512 RepID=A0A0A5G2I1_9BACI|nr:DUF4097 domain-containing protein [Pontibacillus litoralis]KGX86249.1 hypothetical protein N784_05495 [Pontibacillus litoralis JSM 072002]